MDSLSGRAKVLGEYTAKYAEEGANKALRTNVAAHTYAEKMQPRSVGLTLSGVARSLRGSCGLKDRALLMDGLSIFVNLARFKLYRLITKRAYRQLGISTGWHSLSPVGESLSRASRPVCPLAHTVIFVRSQVLQRQTPLQGFGFCPVRHASTAPYSRE